MWSYSQEWQDHDVSGLTPIKLQDVKDVYT